MSLAELRLRFASGVPLSSDDASRLAGLLPLLRRRYNEQLQRAKIQFVDPRLKLSSCRSLLLLARAAAAVSQLIYEAIRPPNDAKSAPSVLTVSPELVEAALTWNDHQLGLIARHLHVLDQVEPQSAWLKALLDQLESRPRVSSSDWTRLARDVLGASSTSSDLHAALTLPSIDLQSYLAEIGHVRHSEVVARGIEAARIVARLAAGRGGSRFDLELLTVAALCQDCGLLLSRERTSSKAASSAQQLNALHPSIGAGLVAGLVEYSTELPTLLAQHHRRLNEPRIGPDLYGRTQNRASRLLALIARWLELTKEPELAIDETLPLAARLAHSVGRLSRETLRGDWDRQLAADLLAALGFRAESDALKEAGRRVSAFENREEPQQRRLDSADEHWPQPKLQGKTLGLAHLGSADPELAKRSREIHHARASAR